MPWIQRNLKNFEDAHIILNPSVKPSNTMVNSNNTESEIIKDWTILILVIGYFIIGYIWLKKQQKRKLYKLLRGHVGNFT